MSPRVIFVTKSFDISQTKIIAQRIKAESIRNDLKYQKNKEKKHVATLTLHPPQ